jgi:transposase-like protein
MERLPRKIYTYEFKLEAVRLVASGQKVAAAAKSLEIVEQTLSNWVKEIYRRPAFSPPPKAHFRHKPKILSGCVAHS